MGTFHRLFAACSKTSTWRLCTEDHLSYTDASFQIEGGMRLGLTLLTSKAVRVTIWGYKRRMTCDTHCLLFHAINLLRDNIASFNLHKHEPSMVLCPHWDPDDDNVCLVGVKEYVSATSGISMFEPKTKKCFLHGQDVNPEDFKNFETSKKRFFFLFRQFRQGISTVKHLDTLLVVKYLKRIALSQKLISEQSVLGWHSGTGKNGVVGVCVNHMQFRCLDKSRNHASSL